VKGGAYLVKALHLARSVESLSPLRLEIAGEGPELSQLRALAEKLAVPARFHGWLDSTKLKALIHDADLLAMPSLWPEPFGLLGLEAGCVGVPCVAYEHGGICDWLEEGRSGTVAPSPPTVKGMADAIVRALGDADAHHQLRIGAWQMAQRFSIERHLRQLNGTLRGVAQLNKCSVYPQHLGIQNSNGIMAR
jgi:glycosyltransferase involved in cell wall biosynthesis